MKKNQTPSFMHPATALSAATGSRLDHEPFCYGFVQARKMQSGKYVAELQLRRADGVLLAFAESGTGISGLETGAHVLVSGVMTCHRDIRYLSVSQAVQAVDLPPEWKLNLIDRDMIANFKDFVMLREIVWRLDEEMRGVICEVLTHADIAPGFFLAPASVAGHHAVAGGNLRHAVEVALTVARPVEGEGGELDCDLAIAAALLHDTGKALEYEAKGNGAWQMSLRGKLIGHKLTGYEYVAAAIRDCNLAPERALSLLHCLSATNAPAYVGMRSPGCLEAQIVGMADRLSGQTDLFSQLRVPGAFMGRRHKHLTEQPFFPAHTLQLSAPAHGEKA
jgi:23S rRNA maturation-related 3'-5' exoribonuclease YhaM